VIEKGKKMEIAENSAKKSSKPVQKLSKNAQKYIPVWELLVLSFPPMVFARYFPVGYLKP